MKKKSGRPPSTYPKGKGITIDTKLVRLVNAKLLKQLDIEIQWGRVDLADVVRLIKTENEDEQD